MVGYPIRGFLRSMAWVEVSAGSLRVAGPFVQHLVADAGVAAVFEMVGDGNWYGEFELTTGVCGAKGTVSHPAPWKNATHMTVSPRPATHAIWTVLAILKAGETVCQRALV